MSLNKIIIEIMENDLKYYTACDNETWEKLENKKKCHCKNYSTCFKCFTNNVNYNSLYCEIH